MVIGHKRQTNRIFGPLEVNVNGEPIKRAQKVKYLGITGQIVKHKARSSSAFTKQSAHANSRLKIKGRMELQLAFGLKFDKI